MLTSTTGINPIYRLWELPRSSGVIQPIDIGNPQQQAIRARAASGRGIMPGMGDRLSLATEEGDVTIARDDYGVPHVRAQTPDGAWFGMGYACAQDRMFQMDYDRRRACGRWAEVAGPAAVADDILARRMSLAAAAQRDVAAMSAPLRAAFGAYARGVNAAVDAGAAPAPGRYAVEPWQPWHSVAAFKIRHVLMGQWQHKLAQAVLLARIGPEAYGMLEVRAPAGSPLAVPPGARLTRLVADAVDDVTRHLAFLAEAEPGSNAWAVSAAQTAHGAAVICNDSHRALDTPNVYWQCRLTCPDLDVIGATFPGLPGFPHFGHNGAVAWAITHADADNQDLYLERFDGSRHLTPRGWQESAVRTERIEILGGGHEDTLVWETRHGPVVHGDPRQGMALALKYTATYRPDRGFECLLPMLTARDVGELTAAQEGWVDPVNNLVAADTGGRIAYQCRGELPVRSSSAHRRLPVPGWDDGCEWVGTVPFSELPRVIDPRTGFVMTANNAIVDGDQPYISYTFAQPARAERLRSRLAGTAVHTPEDLAGMQADTVSWAARAWSRVLGGIIPLGAEEEPAEAARLMLSGWDGDLAADSPQALLYACFQRALAEELYRPLLGSGTWQWVASGTFTPTMIMVRRWLANDTWTLLGGPLPPHGAPDGGAPDGGARGGSRTERVLAAVPAALAGAWADALGHGGPDPARWRWGDVHQAARTHPAEGAGPLPSVPMGGDADTIQAAGYGWRRGTPFTVTNLSVYRQVVDLADPGSASYVIPGGSSGDPESPHFADQLAEWAEHRRIPMV
jgi:penicillin G amidase